MFFKANDSVLTTVSNVFSIAVKDIGIPNRAPITDIIVFNDGSKNKTIEVNE
jgi:hypothetical protein